MDNFLLRAAIGGMLLAVVIGPFGAFIVWRRMAYFGDTLAHSALLGVALGFLLGVNPSVGVLVVCALVALMLLALRSQRRLADDTLLGILSHSALSLGLVALAFLETLRVDLVGYLFGDVLAVLWADIIWIAVGGSVALLALIWLWRPLLSVTIHADLARVEGVPVTAVQLAFMLLISLIIALSMKVVGILLVTSLLIIPAASARRFAATPEQMAALASAIGCAAVLLGLGGSFQWDLPSGPAIVVAAALLFAASLAVPWLRTLAKGHRS